MIIKKRRSYSSKYHYDDCKCCRKKPPTLNCCTRNIEINNNFCYCPPAPPPPTNVLKAETSQYTAISDGIKTVYTNQDKVPAYSTSDILNPNDVSYINLFINGILQPATIYNVQPGSLQLLVDQINIPRNGVPIILQFIKILAN
ncbi:MULTISPECIES: DUF4183 domain-containing protein [Clostridia]|uniref:DUF4183 domain-containing protein n=1 Tax=Clostridia TaxID=186801 RepID=UPI000EA0F023|nr:MULTISPECIES: DUF4183 domain-containing protein [Clostridia]NBJ68033.1 DUF4183 domain-containing protein [Roseburia sp. 1XD42-34]RKI82474.1 DUF4183 domain-containing protein [Clostridium sp. 1xD42-85]